MKTKITIYLVNGENLSEVVDKARREIEAEILDAIKQGAYISFRYTDGVRYIPINSILYVNIKEIS